MSASPSLVINRDCRVIQPNPSYNPSGYNFKQVPAAARHVCLPNSDSRWLSRSLPASSFGRGAGAAMIPRATRDGGFEVHVYHRVPTDILPVPKEVEVRGRGPDQVRFPRLRFSLPSACGPNCGPNCGLACPAVARGGFCKLCGFRAGLSEGPEALSKHCLWSI
jgi:hypothetical protein